MKFNSRFVPALNIMMDANGKFSEKVIDFAKNIPLGLLYQISLDAPKGNIENDKCYWAFINGYDSPFPHNKGRLEIYYQDKIFPNQHANLTLFEVEKSKHSLAENNAATPVGYFIHTHYENDPSQAQGEMPEMIIDTFTCSLKNKDDALYVQAQGSSTLGIEEILNSSSNYQVSLDDIYYAKLPQFENPFEQ